MIYEFKCESCGDRFEAEQSAGDHEQGKDPHCPQCGSSKISHLLSPAFIKTSKKS